jgi:hypothetical protein
MGGQHHVTGYRNVRMKAILVDGGRYLVIEHFSVEVEAFLDFCNESLGRPHVPEFKDHRHFGSPLWVPISSSLSNIACSPAVDF